MNDCLDDVSPTSSNQFLNAEERKSEEADDVKLTSHLLTYLDPTKVFDALKTNFSSSFIISLFFTINPLQLFLLKS